MIHHPHCIENARLAIAENNGATLADFPETAVSDLTPETVAEALEWLENGNAVCAQDGERCH